MSIQIAYYSDDFASDDLILLVSPGPTGSTNSDIFSQTMNINTTGRTTHELFSTESQSRSQQAYQSQSICAFPSYLVIPTHTLTDVRTLLGLPPRGETRQVNVLGVVWENDQQHAHGPRPQELVICEPMSEHKDAWDARKILLRVTFWDGFAEDLRKVKKGDVVWLQSLDHKVRAEANTGRNFQQARFLSSSVCSRRRNGAGPTTVTIVYRSILERYTTKGPQSCQKCTVNSFAATTSKYGNGHRNKAASICSSHQGAICQEDLAYRIDRRLLEHEVGFRKVKSLVHWAGESPGLELDFQPGVLTGLVYLVTEATFSVT